VIDVGLAADVLTATLVDVPSPSGGETRLADDVEATLRAAPHLSVDRDGDAVMARTTMGGERRVVIAGHLDTVPVADNLPSRRDGDRLYGCGTSDMKAGIAVMLRLAVALDVPRHDVTWLFYDNEETDAAHNGLGRVLRNSPDWLRADLAVLMEPTANRLEAGCQGTLRVLVVATGKRAHSARSWLGNNAIHAAGEVLSRLSAYEPRRVEIDGCEYREGLNAVRIEGGVSGNVVPDRCTIAVNHRFAPAALPRLREPAAAEFLSAIGGEPRAKLGWTDVARFASIGIPAVNFGPGDPNLAHTREEYVEVPLISECERMLRGYLVG